MIKFFRNIRHSLIQKNQTGKYFKYAIGEILLVVIGILIALQINNWNKERSSRIEEQSILKNLKEDFNKNEQEIEVLIFANIKYERNLTRFIEILQSSQEKKIIEIADTLAMAAIAAPTYIPTTSTIDVIISTGNIDLIQNEELKTLISRFKREIADLSEDEIDVREIANNQLAPLLSEEDDLINEYENAYAYTIDRNNKFKTNSSSRINNSKLLSTYIALRLYYNKMILSQLKGIHEMQKNILNIINKEIK